MRRPSFFLLAAAFPLLLYARTLTFDFVNADDVDLIAGNRSFLSDLRNVPRAFTRSYFETEGEIGDLKTYYRPVAIVSFMMDAVRAARPEQSRGGADPRAYHATNVVLHALATCLLLALAHAWGAPPLAALAAALVFAAHPLGVQAVAWIAGRNDLLLAVFGLLSLLAFAALKRCATLTSAGRTREPGRQRSLPGRQDAWRNGLVAQRFSAAWMAVHTISFAIALFSKETGVIFPLLAVLHQRLVVGEPLTRRQWNTLAADGSIVILWAWLRAQALAGSPGPPLLDSLRIAWVNAPQVLVQVGKWVVPARLNVSPGVDTTGIVLGIASIALIAFAALRWLPRGIAIAGTFWALAFLLPALVVPGLPAYEHRNYVPLIGILIAGSFFRLKPEATLPPEGGSYAPKTTYKSKGTSSPVASGFSRKSGVASFRRKAAASIVCGVIAVLATRTWQRLDVFEDPFAYWTDAARDLQFAPIAHVNLGRLYELQDRPDDARREYLRALEIDPATPKAHNNLGVVLMKMDQPEQAVRQFREEVRRHPSNAEAWFNLGLFAEQRGNAGDARRYYERAITGNRYFLPAYQKLGRTPPR